MPKFWKDLSPDSKFIIAETLRVVGCIGVIIFARTAVEKLAQGIHPGPSF